MPISAGGAGGPDLTTPRVANGVTYGSPLSNLRAAVKAAGLTHIDIWQGGPESRMVYQARTIVPAFDVRTFMPHHLNARANAQSRFDWKRFAGERIEVTVQTSPRGLLLQRNNKEFEDLTGIRCGIEVVPEQQHRSPYGHPALS